MKKLSVLQDKIMRRYNEGKTIEDISKEMGKSKRAIMKIRDRAIVKIIGGSNNAD